MRENLNFPNLVVSITISYILRALKVTVIKFTKPWFFIKCTFTKSGFNCNTFRDFQMHFRMDGYSARVRIGKKVLGTYPFLSIIEIFRTNFSQAPLDFAGCRYCSSSVFWMQSVIQVVMLDSILYLCFQEENTLSRN